MDLRLVNFAGCRQMSDTGDHGGRQGHRVHVKVHCVHESFHEIRHRPLVAGMPDVRGGRVTQSQRQQKQQAGRRRGPATTTHGRRSGVGHYSFGRDRRDFIDEKNPKTGKPNITCRKNTPSRR